MSYDNHINGGYALVATAPSPATSGTSLTVTTGYGTRFPAAPFNCTVWPTASNPNDDNMEIIRVTAKSGDVFTIVRAQESTTARTIIVGDQIANTVTVKTLTDIEAVALIPAAKGDIISGSGAGTAVLTTVGADGTTMTADAASPGGIKWTTPAGGGDVTGPTGATDGNIAVFNLTTGKVIKDGGTPAAAVAAATHAATGKTTPVDADELGLIDSAASWVLKKLTWANLKATLKTYTDTLYPAGSGTSTGTNTGDQTSVSGNAGTATALQSARTIDGVSFDGTANITVIAPATHAATTKATPVDADEIPLSDSAASFVLKKLTWANLKATLKTYFDGLYQSTISFGTGVLTALGVNVGTAGSVVVNGGALGTPSSGTLTNCTFPTLNQNTSGTAAGLSATLAVASGGTGTASTLTGLMRGSASAMTAAELSGDVTTSGSNATTIANAAVTPAKQSTAAKTNVIGCTIDGGGSAIATGKVKGYVVVPYGATIVAWTMSADAGTPVIKTWKIAAGTAVPTAANSISTSGVGLASGTTVRSTTVTDFTSTTITANDIIAFNVESNTGSATQITFTLEVTRT